MATVMEEESFARESNVKFFIYVITKKFRNIVKIMRHQIIILA